MNYSLRRRIIILAAVVSAVLLPLSARAQKTAVTVNFGDIAALGTLNLQLDHAFAQRVSAGAGVRYNPWTFGSGDCDDLSMLRQRSVFAGMRIWPWYVYSGWYVGTRLQWQEYSRGGFGGLVPSEEGDAYGLVLEGGYALLVRKHWDITFGLAGWGGRTFYRSYTCPKCGRLTGEGAKWFVLPDALILSVSYIF